MSICDRCGKYEADLSFDNTNDGLEPVVICKRCAPGYAEEVIASFKEKCKKQHWNEKDRKWVMGKA